MGAYDDYRARLGDNGSSVNGGFADQSTQLINAAFTDSPMYQQATIDGVATDVRVIRGIDALNKVLTFRPNTEVYMGGIVHMNDGTEWMIERFDPHPYFPKADIMRCNEHFRWHDASGNLLSYRCVVVSLRRKTDMRKDMLMEIGDYQIFVNVPYNNDTISIRPGLRVILGTQVYQVYGIDDASNVFDGKGYIQYGVDVVVSNPYDDFTNKIADNKAYYSQNQVVTPTAPTTNSGGGKITW